MSARNLAVVAIVFVALLLIEVLGVAPGTSVSLLMAMLFWVAVTQGCVALVAAAELSNAKWIVPLKGRLLAVYPSLLIFPFIFYLWGRHIDLYKSVGEGKGWLDPGFFLWRNVILLAVVFVLAHFYVQASMGERSNRKVLAVLYLFSFVACQSLVAFDWVMSLEYPWISTLFGGYFFVEAMYAAMAVAGLLCFFLVKKRREEFQVPMTDNATLTFGFSLFWAGLFFSQYLVIWYGNIPEEVSFLAKRVTESPLKELSVLVLLFLFIIPFLVFMYPPSKRTRATMAVVSLIILAGIFIERLVFLMPVASLDPVFVVVEWMTLGIPPVYFFMRNPAD